jgi:hypothetical protein
VAQRMLLLQEQLEAKERQLEQQGNTSANTMMVPILVSVCVRTCVFVSIRALRAQACKAHKNIRISLDQESGHRYRTQS